MSQPVATATPTRLCQVQPVVAPAIAYTAPAYAAGSLYQAGSTALARRMVVCNTTAAAATLSLYLVPTGGAVGAPTQLLNAVSIAAGQTAIYDLEQEMNPGDTLQLASGTASALTVTVSGAQFQ